MRRGLKRLPPERQLDARAEIVDYLVANALIDQYLLQRNVEVPATEVDAKLNQLREELKKSGKVFEKALEEMGLSEAELKKELTGELRWEKYCDSQATDAILARHFHQEHGHVRRHPRAGPSHFVEEGSWTTGRSRSQTPPASQTDRGRCGSRAPQAGRHHRCTGPRTGQPSLGGRCICCRRTNRFDVPFEGRRRRPGLVPSLGRHGGTLRQGRVRTQGRRGERHCSDTLWMSPDSGYGPTARAETKFEDVRDIVKDVYCEKLRDYLTGQLKPTAQISITPVSKP